MEASTTGEDVLQLVTFTLKDEEYAVDILKVQEINRIVEITEVPNSPHYVEGVINLRGKVIPVVNLRKKFGFEEKPTDDITRIIIMDVNGITNGIMVDSVSEVLRIPASIVEAAPSLSSESISMYIKGIAKIESRLIILIDIEKLIGDSVQL